MRKYSIRRSVCGLLLVVWAFASLPDRVSAAFAYQPRDLVLGLRQSGAASELVVNVGPASQFAGLSAGQTIPITNLSRAHLDAAFGNLDGLTWSISGDVAAAEDPNLPLNTLWVTRPRQESDTPSVPWVRRSSFNQGSVASRITGIAQGALNFSSVRPDGPDNTTVAVVIAAGDANAYSTFIGALGNFGGAFQGNVENTTPAGFVTGGRSARSDLYELKPGTGPGTYLGCFNLGPDGDLSFTAPGEEPPLPPPPSVTRVQRAGQVTTLSFSSVSGAHYRLRLTDAAGLSAPVTNWATGTETLTGTGTELSLTDTAPEAARFYRIEATR